MSEHAILAPSSAPVWGHCSGSVAADTLVPRPETEQTRNGTAAHWLAALCLTNWRDTLRDYDPRKFIGTVCAENGVVIDALIAEGANVYVDEVVSTLSRMKDLRESLQIEFKVNVPSIHGQNWGTLDASVYTFGILIIWDYKHGHAKVDAHENLQLVNYVEGLRGYYNISDSTRVVARIVQPFAYDPRGPVSEWIFTMSDIKPYVAQLRAKAHEALTSPTLTSGVHCRYCPARGRCPALRGSVYDVIDTPLVAFDAMNGAELATERDILMRGRTMLKARLEAIEDELMHRVKRGDSSSGLSLESVQGRVSWTVTPEQAIAAVKLLGVDISRAHCDTPAQARARIPADFRGAFDEAIKSLTKRNRTLKLTETSNTIAARVFSKKE